MPSGITWAKLLVVGGHGGAYNQGSRFEVVGGDGAEIGGVVPVTAGQHLQLYVAGGGMGFDYISANGGPGGSINATGADSGHNGQARGRARAVVVAPSPARPGEPVAAVADRDPRHHQ